MARCIRFRVALIDELVRCDGAAAFAATAHIAEQVGFGGGPAGCFACCWLCTGYMLKYRGILLGRELTRSVDCRGWSRSHNCLIGYCGYLSGNGVTRSANYWWFC